MAERFGMFDSTPEDPREYSMEDFSRFFTMFLTSGIFNGGTNLKVFCDGTNISTKINLGRGWIQGYSYEVYDAPVVLQHELPNPTLDRIDRIVLRLDKTLEHRYLKAFILKGTDAEKPVVPALTRNDNIWEIALAQVQIIKGKSYIEGWQITDERLDNSVCGLVNSLIQADTKTIFDQFQYWYNSKTKEYDENWNIWTSKKTIEFNNWTDEKKKEYQDKTTEFINAWDSWFNTKTAEFLKVWSNWYETKTPALEKQFTDWFSSIKTQLDGDIATNLLNEINKVKSHLADTATKQITATENNITFFDNIGNIKDSGKSVGNTSGKILELPLGLTIGDLLRVGSDGQIERLPKGIDGQGLTLANGLPSWGMSIKIVKGYYTGDGDNFGAPVPQKIVTGFEPKLIMITEKARFDDYAYNPRIYFFNGIGVYVEGEDQNGKNTGRLDSRLLIPSEDGFEVSIIGRTTGSFGPNNDRYYYYYTVIG